MTTRRDKLEGTDWRVYVILDPRANREGRSLVDVARAALAGGAGVLQLRDKESSGRELVELARELTALCHRHDSLFVANDRLDVALAAGADGVHLGPDDIAIEDARRVAPDLIIGGSAGTADRAAKLAEQGADYLGVGAIYDADPSKPDASDPRGPAALTAVADRVDIPILGIGGITVDTAAEVASAGADGVAVIRAVVGADEPERAVGELLAAFDAGR